MVEENESFLDTHRQNVGDAPSVVSYLQCLGAEPRATAGLTIDGHVR